MGNWRIWVKGISAAFIGGGATALAAALSVPEAFAPTRIGVLRLLKLSLVGAIVHAAAYLKQSPLPMGSLDVQ